MSHDDLYPTHEDTTDEHEKNFFDSQEKAGMREYLRKTGNLSEYWQSRGKNRI